MEWGEDRGSGAGDGPALGMLRRALLALVVLGILGLSLELVFLEHYEDLQQWIPFVALGLGLACAIAVAVRPTPATIGAFRLVMAVFVVAGLVGVVLHYQGNVEFELERAPGAGGLALVWEALRGATPALAPGALAQLGLLGLTFAYRHAALRRR
jgi:hypothetical protein